MVLRPFTPVDPEGSLMTRFDLNVQRFKLFFQSLFFFQIRVVFRFILVPCSFILLVLFVVFCPILPVFAVRIRLSGSDGYELEPK